MANETAIGFLINYILYIMAVSCFIVLIILVLRYGYLTLQVCMQMPVDCAEDAPPSDDEEDSNEFPTYKSEIYTTMREYSGVYN